MREHAQRFISKISLFAGTFYPLANTPAGSRLGDIYSSQNLGAFANKVFYAAIAVGAILAVLRLSYAGYLYMTTEAWGHKSHAKQVIGDAILGLLLLLAVWLILNQINPNILNLNVLDRIGQSGATSNATNAGTIGSLQNTVCPNGSTDPASCYQVP